MKITDEKKNAKKKQQKKQKTKAEKNKRVTQAIVKG